MVATRLVEFLERLVVFEHLESGGFLNSGYPKMDGIYLKSDGYLNRRKFRSETSNNMDR